MVGGIGSYQQPSSTNSGVFASLATFTSGSATLAIRRLRPSPAIGVATVEVGVSDGNETKTISVTFTGTGADACPP